MDFDGYNAYGDTEEICANLLANKCITKPPGYYQFWAAAVPTVCGGGHYDITVLQDFCRSGDSSSSKITFGHGLIANKSIGNNQAVCYDVKNPDTGKTVRMFQVDDGTQTSSPEMGFKR